MPIVHAVAIVLTQLSIGSLIITSLLSPRALRLSFFLYNSLGCALLGALALLLTKYGANTAWWEMRYFGLTIIGATAAYGSYRLERPELGRLLLIFAALLGLVFGLLPLGGRALVEHGWQTRVPWLFGLPMVLGALLVGLATVGWLVLLWYRDMRQLGSADLVEFAKVLLLAVGLRLLGMFSVMLLVRQLDPAVVPALTAAVWGGPFAQVRFIARLAAGFVLPLALAIAILRQAVDRPHIPSLALPGYIVASLLVGELLAAFILV